MTILNALIGISVLLLVTVALGIGLRLMQGRARRHVSHDVVGADLLGAESLGEQATLLQFSTDFCTRCPSVHRDLSRIAAEHPGVSHLDVDLTNRPDLAKQFHVLQTPTTLILDRDGVIQTRFGGVPGRGVVELELKRITRGSRASV